MTPLQIAQQNLARLNQELAQAEGTVSEYEARATVLAAQIAALETFIAAQPAPVAPGII